MRTGPLDVTLQRLRAFSRARLPSGVLWGSEPSFHYCTIGSLAHFGHQPGSIGLVLCMSTPLEMGVGEGVTYSGRWDLSGMLLPEMPSVGTHHTRLLSSLNF